MNHWEMSGPVYVSTEQLFEEEKGGRYFGFRKKGRELGRKKAALISVRAVER